MPSAGHSPTADAGCPWWRDPRGYLAAGVLGFVVVLLLDLLLPAAPLGPVYLSDVVATLTLAVTIGLWLGCRSSARLDRLQVVFVATTFATWITVTVLALTRLPNTPAIALVLGALLGFVLLKPPSASQAAWVADLLGWALAAAIVLTLALEVFGLVPSWYDPAFAPGLAALERTEYWIPLADVLGLDARWAGPFVHPGRVGEVGALLLVWGMTRSGSTRAVLAGVGLLTLLVAGSRTSYLAAAAGVAVVLLVRWWPRLTRPLRWASGVAAVVGGVVLVLIVVGANTGLTGRTSVWPVYLDLWRGSPVLGGGDAGINAAIKEGLLPAWAYHAHSLWLDVLARHGVIVLALVVLVVASTVVVAIGGVKRGAGAAAGVVAVVLVSSITHTLVDWRLPDVPLLLLVLAVLSTESARRS